MRGTKVNKRALDVGMTLDVANRMVWNEYAQREVDVDRLFVVRMEKKFGNDINGQRVHQHTICWDGNGNRVIWYHHFEEMIKVY